MDDDWGYPHDLGNHHVSTMPQWQKLGAVRLGRTHQLPEKQIPKPQTVRTVWAATWKNTMFLWVKCLFIYV